MKKLHISRILVTILLISMLLSLVGCSSKKSVTIGSKLFTENIVLAEMYAQLIEAKSDITVNRKLSLGGTSVCMPAMKNGEIDIYFEYTGTAFNEILQYELTADTTGEEIRKTVQAELNSQHDITMFDPLGLNNTFALAMKTDRLQELGITTSSELAPYSADLKFGANHIFYTRLSDGFEGMVSTYELDFVDGKNALKMDSSLLYEAVDTGDLDVIIIYATDAQLRNYNMTVLEDDKGLFPPYEGAPICRNDTLEKYPELNEILNLLAGAIDNATMQELNYRVDVLHEPVEAVAKSFLTENGYI